VLGRRLLLVLAAVSVVVAACGGDDGADPAAQPAGADAAPAEYPAFMASTVLGGPQIDLGALEGTDVVLWFWAPW
jgi:hypothetical protein